LLFILYKTKTFLLNNTYDYQLVSQTLNKPVQLANYLLHVNSKKGYVQCSFLIRRSFPIMWCKDCQWNTKNKYNITSHLIVLCGYIPESHTGKPQGAEMVAYQRDVTDYCCYQCQLGWGQHIENVWKHKTTTLILHMCIIHS